MWAIYLFDVRLRNARNNTFISQVSHPADMANQHLDINMSVE